MCIYEKAVTVKHALQDVVRRGRPSIPAGIYSHSVRARIGSGA